ncbi:hypothetical protein J53TS2_41480 [Paenibacillus sp. J53TS2]|nr:hypothetical protein J53TS2_41480 [Paenibacillus sp. J53TS2]
MGIGSVVDFVKIDDPPPGIAIGWIGKVYMIYLIYVIVYFNTFDKTLQRSIKAFRVRPVFDFRHYRKELIQKDRCFPF